MSDLFDYADQQAAPRARSNDPWTSQEAALGSKANDMRLVLAAHARHPQGLTDFELADLVNRQQTSAGKRRGELRDNGLIEASEESRPAPSGKRAIVWRITPDGVALARVLCQSAPSPEGYVSLGEAAANVVLNALNSRKK